VTWTPAGVGIGRVGVGVVRLYNILNAFFDFENNVGHIANMPGRRRIPEVPGNCPKEVKHLRERFKVRYEKRYRIFSSF
jgi:hypothetical protein